MQVDAIVLAGAKNDGKLQEISSCEYEALIPINGQPMISYVIDALKNSSKVRKIVVVGFPEFEPYLSDDIVLLDCGHTLSENIKIGVDYLGYKNHVLIVTSDIPMLKAEAIEGFIDQCHGRGGDFFYPIISKEANEQKYPGVSRTYVQLKNGTFTGGNLVLMAPKLINDCHTMICRVINLRKKPVKIARLLGIKIIIKLLMHKLTIDEVERRVQKQFGLKATAVVSPYPEIGTDVDKPSDWQLATKVLSAEE